MACFERSHAHILQPPPSKAAIHRRLGTQEFNLLICGWRVQTGALLASPPHVQTVDDAALGTGVGEGHPSPLCPPSFGANEDCECIYSLACHPAASERGWG